jgi:hypothetical protein
LTFVLIYNPTQSEVDVIHTMKKICSGQSNKNESGKKNATPQYDTTTPNAQAKKYQLAHPVGTDLCAPFVGTGLRACPRVNLMVRRSFDEIEEVFGKRLRIHRAPTNAPVFASLKERFSLFPGAPDNWSQIQWEPAKVSFWSAPSGVQYQELALSAKHHRMRWSFGFEFGGPLVASLLLFSQDKKIAECALRLRGITSREQAKDLAFRSAHLAGLSSYRVLQEDHELLLLEFSQEETAGSQNAYRESIASPLLVPTPSGALTLTKQSKPPPKNSPPRRAPDDSYLVVSWSPNAVLHFYASQATNWEEPPKQWEKAFLRESFFDMTRRSLAFWYARQYQEIPFATLQKLWLRRQFLNGVHSVSLELLHENGVAILAESSNQRAGAAYEAIAHLATSLSDVLRLECVTDLAPKYSAAKLFTVSASPELIFAGTDGERAIAWALDASQRYILFSPKKGAMVGISSQPNTWMIGDAGDVYARKSTDHTWREIRPLGRRSLRAVCQSPDGIALAVGDNGCIFRHVSGDDWIGIPHSTMPSELSRELLSAACFSRGVFYIGSLTGNLYRSFDENQSYGESWTKILSFDQPISSLSTSEDGCVWLGCLNGDLFYSQQNSTFSKVTAPVQKPLYAITGALRSCYAVGGKGMLWSSQFYDRSPPLSPRTTFYLACATLSIDSPPPEENGLLPEINLAWHRIVEPPKVSWYGASWHNGFLYVVGEGGLLLRIE